MFTWTILFKIASKEIAEESLFVSQLYAGNCLEKEIKNFSNLSNLFEDVPSPEATQVGPFLEDWRIRIFKPNW